MKDLSDPVRSVIRVVAPILGFAIGAGLAGVVQVAVQGSCEELDVSGSGIQAPSCVGAGPSYLLMAVIGLVVASAVWFLTRRLSIERTRGAPRRGS